MITQPRRLIALVFLILTGVSGCASAGAFTPTGARSGATATPLAATAAAGQTVRPIGTTPAATLIPPLPTATLSGYPESHYLPPPVSYPGPAAPPTASPLRPVHWAAEALEWAWSTYGAVSQPEWLGNQVAKLAVYFDPNGNTGKLVVDLTAGKNAALQAVPSFPNEGLTSPDGQFVIHCGGGLQLYRVAGSVLVSQTSLTPPDLSMGVLCQTYVHWAPDGSAAAFIAGDAIRPGSRELYGWRPDGSAPKKLADTVPYGPLAWAPDSRRIAYVASLDDRTADSTAAVVGIDGQAASSLFNVGHGYDGPPFLEWLADDLLATASRNGRSVFQISTGQHLLDWWDNPASGAPLHQPLGLSPNQRWITSDQGEFTVDHQHLQKQYQVYDAKSRTSYMLADAPDVLIKFDGWAADSSTLYMVSRPANAGAVSDPRAPFGLLAFNPLTRQSTLLFKDAIKADWNADKSWAFVVFPQRSPDQTLGLAGGVWKAGSDTLVGRQTIANKVIFQDPAQDMSSDVLPAAWSHDGGRVVFGNAQGQIILLGTDGAERMLSDDFPGDVWDQAAYRWSPDDRYLLVEIDGRAWIVTVAPR